MSLARLNGERLVSVSQSDSDANDPLTYNQSTSVLPPWARKLGKEISSMTKSASSRFLNESQQKSISQAWTNMQSFAESFTGPAPVLADAPMALELVMGREDLEAPEGLGVFMLEKRVHAKRPVWRHIEQLDLWLAFHRGAWTVLPTHILDLPTSNLNLFGCLLRLPDASLKMPHLATTHAWEAWESVQWVASTSIECRAIPSSALPAIRRQLAARMQPEARGTGRPGSARGTDVGGSSSQDAYRR